MLNKKIQRILCALLAALLLSSCGTSTADTAAAGTETSGGSAEPAEEAAEETEPEEAQIPAPEIEAVDCGGDDYVVLARQIDGGYVYQFAEMTGDLEGDAVDQAIWERNLAIEEKYNLKLVPEYGSAWDINTVVQQEVSSGGGNYDLLMPMVQYGTVMALNGLLTNMNTLPYIDLSKPWWFGSLAEDTSISGRNYWYAGNINVSMLDGVAALFFNKNMVTDMNLDSPYQLAKDGKWTYDAMETMCEAVTSDTNGDGTIGFDDRMGLTVNAFAWGPLFYGTGSSFISKDADDLPLIDFSNERTVSILQKLCSILNNGNAVILVNQHPELETAGGWGQASIDMFTQDRALFWIEVMYGMAQLRDMESDFGVLPIPKYEESDNYATYIHVGHSSAMAIPVTNTELDLAGRILEDMAYESYRILRPAYYDVTLQKKTARDEDSGEMLDILYRSFRMDLAWALSQSGIAMDSIMRTVMIENQSDIVSTLTGQQKAMDATLKGIVKKFDRLP